MKRSATATATVEHQADTRMAPPNWREFVVTDELRFDDDAPKKKSPPPPTPTWLREASGVRAAIARWLEEHA